MLLVSVLVFSLCKKTKKYAAYSSFVFRLPSAVTVAKQANL